MANTSKRKKRKGFTLLEMAITVMIIGIIFGISFQALRNSRYETEKNVAAADARLINDAVRRVEISGRPGEWTALSNIIYNDTNAEAAITWLVTNNYIKL